MRGIVVLVSMVSCAILTASCVTTPVGNKIFHTIACVVEPAENTVFELFLDGDMIHSGKVSPEKPQKIEFSASVGDHEISVMAESHELWKRQIMVLEGPAEPQCFWVQLKKERIKIPTIPR